ncbi:glucose-6-phosphate isomerase [Rasiella rasia]|uniref:Glucose-6-phosphate isomerase n=1 Tax=Rasiella rasia TaxID=2744027 RepID=A0A6G6GJU3_9FLAO|nr:glucose-6-phosphate isomerase [Rasiella rasia]QIE58845.1 glucose-6-phosphate isomerase [Rasiella rasia]
MSSIPKINPTSTNAWKALQTHFNKIKDVHLNDLFALDEGRVADFSLDWNDFYVDISKNRITKETRSLLLQLAEEVNLPQAISAQINGEAINETENRAVLHSALRDFGIMNPVVAETLQKMKTFSNNVIDGNWKGYTGKTIKTIVNIGIGGSNLGPRMVCEALHSYRNHIELRFISNVDGDFLAESLKTLDRETTIFVVVSKTFTTQETRTNAATVKQWFLDSAPSSAVKNHFVAVSANIDEVQNFGILEENIFPMWDWVGGRFSLWSAVGLSICCGVGYHHFEALLKGAHEMDIHFKTAPLSENIPVALGLISVWYNNFFACETEAVIPYAETLRELVPYLQQAIMESNGKSVDRNGASIKYQTGNIIWGATGANSQHAFFQLLHQGTKLIPAEFICFSESLHTLGEHHNILLANCLAQTEALMEGKDNPDEPFRNFVGNNPSTTLLIRKLTPKNLGSLLALYEHKLFVQGIVWNIYSYDQWGVELGKKLATKTLKAIQNKDTKGVANASTKALLKKL